MTSSGSGRPAIEADPLLFAEHHPRLLVVGEHRDHPFALALDGGDAVRCVLAAKDVQLPGLCAGFVPLGRALRAVWRRRHSWDCCPTADPSGIRGRRRVATPQQQRGGEFRTIEMPVQRFAGAIGHHICARERVLHDMQPLLVHRCRQEPKQRFVFVDSEHDTVGDLVGANGWPMVSTLRSAGWSGASPGMSGLK